MKQLESKLQQQCVRWFRYEYPNHVLFAIPNGGQRDVRVAARMKAEGALAGIPDLFLAETTSAFGGLFIEMKIGKTKPTPAQDKMHDTLRTWGYEVVVCRSFDEFMNAVKSYLE